MRTLGLLLLLVGAWLAAQGQSWLPDPVRLTRWVQLPPLPVPLLVVGATLGLLGLGLIALPRRRRQAELSDATIRGELERRGFLVTTDVGGWRADGEWGGRKALIRRVSGYEAARFGRTWLIEVSLRGRPREPWPILPEEGKVVDVRDHGFTVVIPALGRAENHPRFTALIDAVIASVQS